MGVIGSDQITIIDVTDAYSVILTNESHTFLGTINAAKAGSTTTQIVAMRGSEPVACSVTLSEITKPTGVTVTKDTNATSPTLTISVSTSVTSDGTITIPVHVGDITINKVFSFAIAFTGATGATGATGTSVTVTKTETTYTSSTSTTQPTSGWSTTIPTVAAGSYLWTKCVTTYSDGKTATTYTYAKQGETGAKGDTGTSVTVTNTETTYASSTSTTQPTSGWSSTMPAVAAGSYLWTKVVTTFSDGKTATSYTYALQGKTGETGAAGADAITLTVESSNGLIFKNSSISTVLTARVFKAGVELTEAQITALGTVKWYKDGGTSAVATGITYTIDAGDVANKASFSAQLES